VEVRSARGGRERKNKLNYRTKQQLAYEIIRTNILEGTYKPQQHLLMADLIEEIGISAIPIREALKQLETEGFVKSYRHRGVQVALYSPKEFKHLYMIRAVLEGLAGKLGTENITEAGINRMKELLAKMGMALEKDDLKEKIQTTLLLDAEFHQILYQAADSQQLLKMITNIRDNTYHNIYISLAPKYLPGYHEHDHQHHIEVFNAVAARDPELVERLLKDRISNTGKVMFEYLTKS
jgi:DNA-binding GntR family transcriptional regulator